MESFERKRDDISAWEALYSFHCVLFFLEKIPTPQIYLPLEDANFNEKLTVLLEKIKQSDILEFEEKRIEAKIALPNVSEAQNMVEKVKNGILRAEIYLAGVLEKRK